MTFEYPRPDQIPRLLRLWKEVFGDHNGFWELFLETGFQSDHCRLVLDGAQLAAALCWLDCTCDGQKIAYVYAVVTDPAYRSRGLCRSLLGDTHALLREQDYSLAMLVPEGKGLRNMYGRMGYADVSRISEISVSAGAQPVSLTAIGPEEFARLRREFLPRGGVIQEGRSLAFLARQAQFYRGEDFLLTAWQEDGVLHGMELLGNSDTAPGIVTALGCRTGQFRCPGEENPFAMAYSLAEDAAVPEYFGFAFD